jgi:DNA repair exonuclease SbcCD ATPase subunit
MAMLETYRPRLEGALILDEPAKHVSDDFLQPTAQFLKVISDFFGRQVIMVTHIAHLAETAETAYSVVLKDGQSVVTRT